MILHQSHFAHDGAGADLGVVADHGPHPDDSAIFYRGIEGLAKEGTAPALLARRRSSSSPNAVLTITGGRGGPCPRLASASSPVHPGRS